MKLRVLETLVVMAALLLLAQAEQQPNILFLLTDDQDWHMQSLQHMPLLQKYLINEGILYSNHYCTVALCCPSRVNLWTGKAAHNTNVTDIWAPYGGYPKIVREGINNDYLPHWLQAAGYNTYYSGKLWNHHTTDNYNKPFAGGFNASSFLLDPHTYQYRNATITHNGGPPVNYAGEYSPDLTAKFAYDHLDEALARGDDRPWFVVHSPIAPHSTVKLWPSFSITAPEYAERHAHLFKDYMIPRGDNFNPEVQGGVSWVKQLPRLNNTVIEYNDEFQRSRLRALQSVDEMVGTMVKKLSDANQLDNTYIFYTTDNGYHLSQHRLHPGKECGFDTDVHIPLIVRGPNVPAGHVSKAVTAHTDIASTILGLIGERLVEDQTDGTPIPLSQEAEKASKQEHVTIEYWGLAIPEGLYGWYGTEGMNDSGYDVPPSGVGNNTYKAIRVISNDYNLYYTVWCTNESELYDLKSDPGETKNLLDKDHRTAAALYSIAGRPVEQVVARLDALTMVLKSCKGQACVQPWHQLHPAGDVDSLRDSLRPEFDDFYDGQVKVSFTECKLGYIPEFEGSMEFNKYGDQDSARDTQGWWLSELRKRGPWSVWT